MPLSKDAASQNAMGGTELMKYGLVNRLGEESLSEFQLFVSRVEEPLDETKIRVLWIHDLPGDPANDHLKENGWDKFHRIVFVSNWQMQAFINYYRIPWSKCIVLQNAIDPLPHREFDGGSNLIRLIYTPTPHRGLNILLPVFDKLCEKFDNLELDVYSSFKLYGWEDRDKDYEELYEMCRKHPKVNYHGSVPNDEIRDALQRSHVFAYPSTWPETSCLCLIEAMSAGLVCVHPNYAGLYETAANWTYQYHWNEDINEHAKMFYTVLATAIEDVIDNKAELSGRLKTQKSYVDIFYSWGNRLLQWEALLNLLKATVKERGFPKQEFIYRV